MTKVAINGMGRIGRAALKIILETPELELAGVNDIADIENIAYLLKYDTVYGKYNKTITTEPGKLIIDEVVIPYHSERNPADLPWNEAGVELVFESTGFFTKQEDAAKHIDAGAKWVIISAPTKSDGVPTVVHGVNSGNNSTQVISCASCTTNNITPVVEIMGRRIGVKKAIMTTVHAYTSTQSLVDAPNPSGRFRRGRAAAESIIPASTGAAIATTKALPDLAGKFDGVALRVPVPVGSIADITFVTERTTSVDEVNDILREEAESARYREVIGVETDEIVSSDIIQDPRASIIDLTMTQVVDGDLVKVMTWYDNEWGYTNQMIREAMSVLGLKTPVTA